MIAVKKFSVLVLMIASVLSLVGSVSAQGGAYVMTFDLPAKPATEGAYAGVDPSGKTVTFWHSQTGKNEATLKALAEKFNAGNPWKITVTPVQKGSYDTVYNSMLAALRTKEVPNLTVAYQNQAAQYQNVKALVDINELANDKTYGFGADMTGDFVQGFLQSDVNPQFGNQRLGMAMFRSGEVMYYNVDALKALGYSEPPKNWEQFGEMSCKYKDSGADRVGYQVRTNASFTAAAAFAQGGDIYDYQANKFTYDAPAVVAAPTALQDLYQKGCVGLITNPAAFSDQNDFAAQKAIFYINSTSGINFIKDAIAKSGKPFAWDITSVPYKDKPVLNVYGASVSIPKTTKEQELAAWLFVRWFTEPDQQATWATSTFYFPLRQSTAKQLGDFFKANPQYEHAFGLLKDTKAEPPISAYSNVRNMAQQAFENVLDGKPVEDEFSALNGDANGALAKDPPGAALPTPRPSPVPTQAATAAATAAK